MYHKVEFSELVGKTIKSIDGGLNSDELVFRTDTQTFVMCHDQDCCESVDLNDIVGDLQDLIGTPVVDAYEESEGGETDDSDSFTWTFYRISTIKGTVVLKWYGTSNGCYSESVDFAEVVSQ